MPIHNQTWSVHVIHGREGQERDCSSFDIQVGPDKKHAEVSIAVCVLVADALWDMGIRDSDIDDGFDLIVIVRRKN